MWFMELFGLANACSSSFHDATQNSESIHNSFRNLNLLRSITPDICVNVPTVQGLDLDYLVVLYPLLFEISIYDRKIIFYEYQWFGSLFKLYLLNFQSQWMFGHQSSIH